MTDKEIVERAKEAEKRTGFGELVHSPISKGVNSAFGIGFIEGMVEYRNYLQEEPVSEELEKVAKHYLYSNILYDDVYVGNPTDKDCIEMFKAGANWQKEQLLAKAVDAVVKIDAGGYPYIPQMELYDYLQDIPLAKEGDKYKVVLIKGE